MLTRYDMEERVTKYITSSNERLEAFSDKEIHCDIDESRAVAIMEEKIKYMSDEQLNLLCNRIDHENEFETYYDFFDIDNQKTMYTQFENLVNINDSMMFDSYTEIAVLVTPEGKEAELEVRGEVRVTTYDENDDEIATYRSYSEMPDDLKAKIADGSYLDDEKIYVGNNNWFEVFYDDAFLCEVVDVENCTPEEIYSIMAEYINDYEKENNGKENVVPVTLDENVSVALTYADKEEKNISKESKKGKCNIERD